MVLKHKGSPSGPLSLEKIAATIVDTAIGVNTTAEVTATVTGILATDMAYAETPAALPAGLAVVGVRCAANSIIFRFMNTTAGALNTGTAFNVNVNRYK